MAFIERSVSALAGVLAIAACKPAAPSRPTTSSVVVEDAGSKASLVVEAPKEDAAPPAFPNRAPLRAVDWKNFDYGGWSGQLHEGHAESHIYPHGGGAHDTFETAFIAVAYGDLDGDGIEEAVVALKKSIWIAKTSRETVDGSLHAYAWKDGAPKSIAVEGFIGPPTAVRIEHEKIIVDEARCVRTASLKGDKLVTSPPVCPP